MTRVPRRAVVARRRTAVAAVVAALAAAAITPLRADSYTAFFRAVGIDNVGVVEDLLARGFDPNAADVQGNPALLVAMRDGAERVAAALLAHPRIAVDLPNAAGETALMIAAIKGRIEWVPRLIARGAAIDRAGWTPLHYAASGAEATPVVSLLLDRGAAIDARAPNGNTPLMMASRDGAWTSADLLLLRGADPRIANAAGRTPRAASASPRRWTTRPGAADPCR